MADIDSEFLRELLDTFRQEAAEHLEKIVSGLLELEKDPVPARRQEVVEEVYRSVHSMKGAARAVNAAAVEGICQAFEGVLAAMKRGEFTPTPSHFDLFQQTADLFAGLLNEPQSVTEEERERLARCLCRLTDTDKDAPPAAPPESQERREPAGALPHAALPGHQQEQAEETAEPLPEVPEDHAAGTGGAARDGAAVFSTVRIATSRLDTLFRQAEEMLVIKLNAGQRLASQRAQFADCVAWERAWRKLAPEFKGLRATMGEDPGGPMTRFLDFLEWNRSFMEGFKKEATTFSLQLEEDHRAFTRMVDEHLDETKRALMLPFAALTPLLPKMVRDLGREQGKEIELTMSGTEIGLDRRVLEALKDPLLHLLRNSIDHGIEGPEARLRAGKAPAGRLAIEVRQTESNRIEVAVRDDGRGVDRRGVIAAAVKAGRLANDVTSSQDILPLLLASGVTTSRLVTDISGRGLGLAIVKENIEKVGGEITLESTAGAGTCFRLMLPAVLSSFKGVFIRSADQLFAIPSQYVRQVLRLAAAEVRTVEGRETIALGDDVVSLVRLAAILHPEEEPAPAADRLAIVDLQAGRTRMAFVVDQILHQGEGLTKGLGKPLVRVRNVAGVTVLGSGELAPILNVSDLLLSARHQANTMAAVPAAEAATTGRAILVAEDSATSRTLLKNVLQSAGYRVTTAVDGQGAWDELKTGHYDAVVSDIEMPRLDGIELTTRIRAAKNLAELPVVLVTTLDSREDRERGVAAGANAYLAKSSFDQTNLLEVLRRLV